ncbi:hypothetical protein, partial [Oleiphilus sp. HI0043]
ADEWLAASEHHKGSWWTHWNDWLQPYKGEEIEARLPEAGKLEVLCDAPGTYVKRKLGVMN